MTSRQQVSSLIATFAHRSHAECFVAELKRAGFSDDEIGVLGPHGSEENLELEEDAVAGAITGGMVGTLAGAVATGLVPGIGLATGLLAGIVGGATTGGILGALVGLGIHEEKACRHEQEVLAGNTLVLVQAPGRAGEAMAILRRCKKSWAPTNANGLHATAKKTVP